MSFSKGQQCIETVVYCSVMAKVYKSYNKKYSLLGLIRKAVFLQRYND